MGDPAPGITTTGKASTGWLLWGYPVLALAILSILAAAVYDLVRPVSSTANAALTAPSNLAVQGTGSMKLSALKAEPPVSIDIPKLAISAAVDPVGLNPDGTMEVPSDFARTGWFKGLEAPGMPGTAVIVGHLDSRTGPAVFYRLRELSAGDVVSVKLADGRAADFVVERTAQFPKDRFPTIDVYAPSSEPRLRLITCGGSFDRRSRHYRDNVVVYASQKGVA